MESWSESISSNLVLELNAIIEGEDEKAPKSSLSDDVKSIIVSPELTGDSNIELKINLSEPLPPLRISTPSPPFIVSSPYKPKIVSLPANPLRVSLFAVPAIISLDSVPSIIL